MIFKPFRGYRPSAELADRIPSLPYDVLDSAEARALAQDDPHSFLHVIKPEIDLADDVDAHDQRVYAKGRENLDAMLEQGWLLRDPAPAYYIYRLRWQGHEQTGILGVAAVEDYVQGRIKKHELTRPEKERDRLKLNSALDAHPGPVFLAHSPVRKLDVLTAGISTGEPAVDFTAADGVSHSLWTVTDPQHLVAIEALFGEMACTYIADGHHRTAVAAKLGAERLASITAPTGDEPCNYFIAVHFPADQLQILDYNRVIADLNGLKCDSFVERVVAAGFDVAAGHSDRVPPRNHTFGMYVDGKWFLLTARPEIIPADDPVRSLDVSILGEYLLGPVLSIGDPRTDQRIDFVGGIRGMDELERRVDGGGGVAFAAYPTTIEQVMSVADAGLVMPPKSTWFEPKLRSGMVLQRLTDRTL
jgi:uncharacterized protein (DUF1015 family)